MFLEILGEDYKVINLNFLMVVFSSKLVAQMGLAHCVCVDDLKRYLILLAYQYATSILQK